LRLALSSLYPIKTQIPYPAANNNPQPLKFITTAIIKSFSELFIRNLKPMRIKSLSARREVYPAFLLLKSKEKKDIPKIAH